MRKTLFVPLLLFLLCEQLNTSAQKKNTDTLGIFADDVPMNVTLITDYKMLMRSKREGQYQNAVFITKLPDSTAVTEQINVRTRGKFRLDNCNMPGLRLNFRTGSSPRLAFLKELKLVNTCNPKPDHEQLVIKEYLVYKMLNLLTDLSLKVRLMRVTYQDSKEQRKPLVHYAFLIEDIDAMAARNGCKELNNISVHPQVAHREQMTLVDVFEYMIGNLDWSVRGNHNMKVVQPKDQTTANPYPVPYDFDFCGLVNAEYSNPPPNLPVESVRQRLYRGYPRSMEELQKTFEIYNRQKDKIYALIRSCEFLQERHKKDMIGYLDEFYRTVNNKREIQTVFIDNARRE
jgi:hypothetical protein